ncbi:MAG: ABC transporter substrate-binding protein [Thermoplasmata archaeon]
MELNPNTPVAPRPRTVSAVVFVVALLVVAGVAVAATALYYELQPSTTPGNLVVTDDLGRTVTVPTDPARVVVLSPSIMDSMFRLGLRSHVVGVDCYAPSLGGLSDDYSPDQISLWNLSSSMCVQIGPTFDAEQLLNDSPQLVLASTIVSVADVETISVDFHIPVVMLQPPTLSGILVDITLLGEIFNIPSKASALNVQLQSVLGAANGFQQNLTDNGSQFPTVLVTYDVDSNGYWTYGPGTFGQSLIELASASSISANATFPYPELSPEVVLASTPDFLIYGLGFGLNLTYYQQFGPEWSQISAVQDGNAVGINSNFLTEPDPTMILDGLPQLVEILHPGNTV